jgi:hypothetical protein
MIESSVESLLALSNNLLTTALALPVPATLSPPTAEESVENARKSLRMLRNLQDLTQDMENWLRLGEPPQQMAKAGLLATLIKVYAGLSKLAHLQNPELLNHFTIENANFAAGSIALSITLHTLDILPETHPDFVTLDAQIDNVPEEWDIRQAQSTERLIDDLESGLAHLAGKPMGDKSPIDKLLEISEKIQQTARELYSIDTLQEPAREESVELAREILRRLKNMLFSDKPIEDAIDTGKPNDKLAFARKISEMADMYKNLLAQAAITNPEIMSDLRVKQANEAVGNCADGISKMINKELPNNHNVKEKQQEDNDKNTRQQNTTQNIMQSMEGGVECAATEIKGKSNPKNELEQKNAAEQARAQIEAARMVRRRLRREQMALKTTTAPLAKPIIPSPINSATSKTLENKSPVSAPKIGIAGLNMEALAAVRQAGNALKNSNRQAGDMLANNAKMAAQSEKNKPTPISADDKIAPDDKGFAQRKLEQDKNDPRNRPRIV